MQPADRTKLRMERLKQLELEQLQWEQEALVMPEDLNRALFLSFESVKTEFSDLDGLSWSRCNPWHPQAIEQPTPKLTCTEIDVPDRTPAHSPTPHSPPSRSESSFPPQDTIRVSRSRSPLQPANQFFPTHHTPSRKDPPAHRSVSPYSLPPANLPLACHGLRHPAYRRS